MKADWATAKAARYAMLHWHYAQAVPFGRLNSIGIWEGGEFVGAVVFGRGANRNIGSPYGLKQGEVCELVRVALKKHEAPVTQIVAQALCLLKRHSPKLRLVVSYADEDRGHLGVIYQAGNWIYVGMSHEGVRLRMPDGRILHKKTAQWNYGTCSIEALGAQLVKGKGKHKYLYPLDRRMRRQVDSLRKPYPKAGEAARCGT